MSIARILLSLVLGPQRDAAPGPVGLLRRPDGRSRAALDAHGVY